jgi:hypothetical protein
MSRGLEHTTELRSHDRANSSKGDSRANPHTANSRGIDDVISVAARDEFAAQLVDFKPFLFSTSGSDRCISTPNHGTACRRIHTADATAYWAEDAAAMESAETVNRMRPFSTMESWVKTLHSRT